MYWLPLGIVIGFMMLTRTEGGLLAGVLILIEAFRRRGLGLWAIQIIILLTPWLVYLQLRVGVPNPTSYHGKQVGFVDGIQVLENYSPNLRWLFQSPPILYVLAWIGYLMLGFNSLVQQEVDQRIPQKVF